MNKQTFLVVFLMALFLMPMISASLSNLGTYKTGDCVKLKQICASCSYNTLTQVSMPDSTTAISGTLAMTKIGTTYNYTFCNTSQAGLYSVDGFGDIGGTDTTWNYNFQVTATGSQDSTGKAITYMVMFTFALLLMLVFLFVGLSQDGKNKTDEMTGYIIAVSNVKYIKYTCLGFAWVCAVFITYLSWMISFAFLDFAFMTTTLKMLFTIMAVATLPAFLLFCYIIIANLVKDSKIGEALQRGLPIKG